MTKTSLEPSLVSSAYTDPAQFAAEKEGIFSREWVAVCRVEAIASAGNHHVVDVAGESVLIVRGADGALLAHYNVCRHRGARLCQGAAGDRGAWPPIADQVNSAGLIRCPYHGWVYEASGALYAAPYLGDDIALDVEKFRLHPVGLAEWGGFIFLNLSPEQARPFPHQIAEVDKRIANYQLADLRIGRTITYEVEANWKIICENYNECYHCGPVHPELCALVPAFRQGGGAGLDWSRGIPHREGAFTFTRTGQTNRAPFPALNADERTRHKGELVYPNLFLSLAADHVAVFILHPRGPASTTVECLFLFSTSALADPAFDHSDASEFWDLVNQQDWAICERVQQGVGSRAHRQGFYAPMEDANLDMRLYLAEKLGRP